MGKERQSSVSAVDKRLDEASSGADFLSLNVLKKIQRKFPGKVLGKCGVPISNESSQYSGGKKR